MSLITNPLNFSVEEVPDYFSEVATVATDIAVANNTLVTVPLLELPYGPYQRFLFNYGFHFTTNATADFKFRLALPVAATLWRNRRSTIAPDALTTLVTTLDVANNGTTDLTVVAAGGTNGYTAGEGLFVAGATAGVLTVQFAQNTTNAGLTTLRAGSFFGFKQY
jgi:hypothetical protein